MSLMGIPLLFSESIISEYPVFCSDGDIKFRSHPYQMPDAATTKNRSKWSNSISEKQFCTHQLKKLLLADVRLSTKPNANNLHTNRNILCEMVNRSLAYCSLVRDPHNADSYAPNGNHSSRVFGGLTDNSICVMRANPFVFVLEIRERL